MGVTPILVAAGVVLYGFPHATEQLWAWPMGPSMTALAVGGGYLAGATVFLRAARQPRWHVIALVGIGALRATGDFAGGPPAMVFAVLLGTVLVGLLALHLGMRRLGGPRPSATARTVSKSKEPEPS